MLYKVFFYLLPVIFNNSNIRADPNSFSHSISDLVYVWCYDGYVRIMVIYHDFSKNTLCSFYKIMMDHRDSDISTVIPNKHLLPLDCDLSGDNREC